MVARGLRSSDATTELLLAQLHCLVSLGAT